MQTLTFDEATEMPFRTRAGRIGLQAVLGFGIAASVMAATAVGQTLDKNTPVVLDWATIGAVGSMGFLFIWRISTSYQKIMDKMDAVDQRSQTNTGMIKEVHEDMRQVERIVDGLWCRTQTEVPAPHLRSRTEVDKGPMNDPHKPSCP